MPINAEFPEKLQCLFEPKRYKVLYGGRGASRSWSVSRALLLMGTKRPMRVLCARELQKSISESVHKVLSDQVNNLGLQDFYEVQVNKIIGRFSDGTATTFSFEGIKNNVSKIRSYEGVDVCWVEEAVKVSKSSWKVLVPTIRKEVCPNGHKLAPPDFDRDTESDIYQCKVCGEAIIQSEIWMTFNPELATDYTYTRFVLNANPKYSFVVKMTYKDNPWFPRVLYDEMVEDKKEDFDSYLNVWMGEPLQMLEGVVFAKELRRAQDEGRICSVPWDEETPVDVFWDLGRSDNTSLWFVQRVAMQYRVLAYFEDNGEYINYYLKYCQSKPYVYGTFYMPHDAAAKRIGEKRSIEQITRKMGFRVVIVPRTAKKANAINAARVVFPNCFFDEENCSDGLDRLRHYRYQVIEGQFSQEPLHDVNSDAADGFMTMGQSIKLAKGPSKLHEALARTKSKLSDVRPGLGWLGG